MITFLLLFIKLEAILHVKNNYKNLDKIYLKNKVSFGPYDQFCSLWNFISLAGLDEETWTPQYSYWKRPEKMDDGGKNLQ